MSLENAERLIEKLSNNDAAKAKLKAAGGSGFEEFAKSEGLPCTTAEFTEATKLTARKKLDAQLNSLKPMGIVGVGSIGVV